jgi:hypothetical protein
MPGFGRMIGAPKRLERRINIRIIRFFEFNAQNIVLAVHVLDVSTFLEVTWRLEKKGFISVDVEMVQFLAKTLGEFPLVAANKIDKADKKKIDANLKDFMHRIRRQETDWVLLRARFTNGWWLRDTGRRSKRIEFSTRHVGLVSYQRELFEGLVAGLYLVLLASAILLQLWIA